MNIYLIGMMGSGKSVTGKKLALKLGCGFVDLDERIQQRARLSISEIFSKHGEPFFRDEESEALREASGTSPRVVATGGGTVLRPVNIQCMKATGRIIFLETSPDMLWERVKEKKDRPLLHGGSPRQRLLEIYAMREPIYENCCDFKVNTDGKTAAEAADQIYEWLQTKV